MKRRSIFAIGSKALFTISFLLLGFSSSRAQVILTNLNPYTQNFNSLPVSGTSTWNDNITLTGWYADNGPVASLIASDGSDNTAGLKNYGSTSASDRALGCVTSNATGNFYYGIRFRNNTGAVIRDFIVSYRLEQWRIRNNKNTKVYFSYKKGSSVSVLTGSGWNSVADLDIQTDNGGSNNTVDGNLAGNFYLSGSILISDIELANGEEIMFRWNDPDNNSIYLGLDDITITPSNAERVFYNQSSGNLQNLNSWTENSDGSPGQTPASFSGSYQTFVIKNSATATISGNWNVSGNGSRVVVGNGNANVNFTIPSGNALAGQVAVTNNATLTINNATSPTLGTLDDQSTVVFNNPAAQLLTKAKFGNLLIAGGIKTLSANTEIKQNLTLSGGKLDLGNFSLTIDANAGLSGGSANSYIITSGTGSLKQQVRKNNTDVVFPVGTSAAYLPVNIKLANTPGTLTDLYSVKAIDFVYDNYAADNTPTGAKYSTKAVNKTWIVDEEVPGNSDVTLTFGWDNVNAFPDFDLNQTRITHFHDGGWDDAAPATATLTNGLYTISRSNITSFSPFGVFSGNPAPLPVELLSFEGKASPEGITCTWETASEKNNHYFGLERSFDGKEFQEIARIKGAGTSNQLTRYRFTDTKAPVALTYYRLRQTDLDGTFTYSKILAVSLTNRNQPVFSLYPNPGQSVHYLKAQVNSGSPVQISVTNSQGKTILSTAANSSELLTGFPVDLSGKPAGLYLLHIRNGNAETTLRLLQQ